ncbi:MULTISPECIES: VrrA/YqfQ family protein [Bacillus]|uniref:VrrA/YqfQ family protein n=1 Tax=Bacillus TaxID=1386 RepID=UPI00081FC5B7|nr:MULTISPECIES: VrrA/YqfQ family protein [Bacillus]AOC56124.1 spore coat protein [Bacillus pumilus]AZV52997.1 spore coat protein [Bacillus pumilus]MBR0585475.1 spore coat protein [Bacillus pumilus DW2J2]MBR0616442.1 spore coat protein [Bacillus pumilus]MBR0619744.1 spore coat protein [Bacillus pumilus]
MLGQKPMGDFQPHRPSRRHLGNGGQPGIFQRGQQPPIEQPFQGQGNQFQQMIPRSPSVQGGGIRGMGGMPGGESRALGGGTGMKGMLAKFLPGAGGAGVSGGGAGLQGIQSFTNPATLSSMLGNVQKVLGMAQQFTPMIQQYGPLVRNLPAMIKLYSQLGSADDETGEDEEPKEIGEETEVPQEEAARDDEIEENKEPEDILVKKAAPHTSSAPEAKPKKRPGSSVPKLYV